MKTVTGHMFKRSGKWVVAWQSAGKRYKRTTGTGSRRKAERIRDEFLAPFKLKDETEILRGMVSRLEDVTEKRVAIENAQPALIIGETWRAWHSTQTRPTPQTLEQYRFQWEKFRAWLRENRPDIRELRQITRADAVAYTAALRQEVTPSTWNRHITLLRSIFRELADNEEARLTGNPFDKIKRQSCIQQSRRELTIDELRRVCESAEGELRILLALGIYTGLRLADAVLLEWGAVDLMRQIITNRNRKTGKAVAIPIHPTLMQMLSEIPAHGRQGQLLPEMAKLYRERRRDRVTNAIQAHFKECGIRIHQDGTGPGTDKRAVIEVGFHSLRHSFVSMNAAAGTPLAMMQALVGHANPAMTRHYVHEDIQATTRAIHALPAIIGSAAPTALPAPAGDIRAQVQALADRLNGRNWKTVQKELIAISRK